MKQICVSRNDDDVSALLGHAQAVMRDMRANPDKDDVYTNPDASTLSGLYVLASSTDIELHCGTNNRTITLPLSNDSIDNIVAHVMQSSDPSGTTPGQSAKMNKGIKS